MQNSCDVADKGANVWFGAMMHILLNYEDILQKNLYFHFYDAHENICRKSMDQQKKICMGF